jgi:hypothetical protein
MKSTHRISIKIRLSSFLKESLPRLSGEYPERGR